MVLAGCDQALALFDAGSDSLIIGGPIHSFLHDFDVKFAIL